MVNHFFRAQAAMEYLLLLAVAGLLTISVLASTRSELASQTEFSAGVSARLASQANDSFAPPLARMQTNATEPILSISLRSTSPLYLSESSAFQAMLFNSGVPCRVASLEIIASPDLLTFSPESKLGVPVSLASAVSFIGTPMREGVATVTVRAVGERGEQIFGADGSPLAANKTVVILPARAGSPPVLKYSISLERRSEAIAYALSDSTDPVYLISLFSAPQGDGGTCLSCPPYPFALWRYVAFSSTGTAHPLCACLYQSEVGRVSAISSRPEAKFVLSLNITNASGVTTRLLLSESNLSSQTQVGSAELTGMPAVAGDNPASDSVVIVNASASSLRAASKYADYRAARIAFESALNGAGGDCQYDCNGAIAAMRTVNQKASEFMAASVPHACNASNEVVCAASGFTYPPISVSLEDEFLGARLQAPQQSLHSGINIEVSSR